VHRLDANLPVVGIDTMEQRVRGALRGDRFNLLLVAAFAAVAIALASVGIYGAMAHAVAQRTQEFGIRLALGAGRADILALALGHSVRLGGAGTALGFCVSLALARILGNALHLVPGQHEGVLYGVTLTDPLTLTGACLTLLAVAAVAGLVPARRATRVDPVVALRAD
jgi:ABC-type antimicrobial peptide transport system permease subunit